LNLNLVIIYFFNASIRGPYNLNDNLSKLLFPKIDIKEDDEELEYVEIENSSEEINNRKKLYMDNDDSDQMENQKSFNQIDEKNNIDFKQKKQSITNLASKRPIQNATETLDIEPLDEQNLVQDNKKSEKFEIDDPW